VWIDDDHLPLFGQSKGFEAIVSSHRAEWSRWVQEKIDRQEFRNVVLKLEKYGRREINLQEMEERLKPV